MLADESFSVRTSTNCCWVMHFIVTLFGDVLKLASLANKSSRSTDTFVVNNKSQ